ncbi:zf-HC2 domain-containing protein [Streptomyces abyssomicinicus]|uniref:zf-HC2 domain-containing protein n=1 Tax=Streptomyces abyssomicinicus TaxID=574929 RepID=UPI001250C7E0|nr:zf-HC2 domain-containing protein [Streptomyces abyssomicinicus]
MNRPPQTPAEDFPEDARPGDGPGHRPAGHARPNRSHAGRWSGPGDRPEPAASARDTRTPGAGDDAPSAPATHRALKSLLGAWALSVCTPAEAAAVDAHLPGCRRCADEARSLREAVHLLQRPESLDLDPMLRTRVLDGCLDRRPPRIPVPEWAMPYDAETARLDALLQDIDEAEWHAPVRLRWIEEDEERQHRATVAKVLAHLFAVDGLVAVALGLPDPLSLPTGIGGAAPIRGHGTPTARTRAYWAALNRPPTREVRAPWREQSHGLVRTASFTGTTGGLPVVYGPCEIPLRDAMLERAFACWVHGGDIADAVNYPYRPPAPRHLHAMIDLAARRLPEAIAARRRAGLAAPGPGARHLVPAGRPGRSLLLEIEGRGGGDWLIPLDSPAALPSENHVVGQVVLDDEEFAQLVAGHIRPRDAAAGQTGDKAAAVADVLFAAASLSRL